MRKDTTNDRRGFLKTAGAALVAASLPAAMYAQNARRPTVPNNIKQIGLALHVADPNPLLPGIFGLACISFYMTADINGRSGVATLSDPVFPQINSHIDIESSRTEGNNVIVFKGTIKRSQSSELMGRRMTIKVYICPDNNCDLSLTVEGTELQWLLLPAIQKVRDKA